MRKIASEALEQKFDSSLDPQFFCELMDRFGVDVLDKAMNEFLELDLMPISLKVWLSKRCEKSKRTALSKKKLMTEINHDRYYHSKP